MTHHKQGFGLSGPIIHQAICQPSGKKCRISGGQSILEAARLAGIDILAACGGVGSCGTCLVKIYQGTVTDLKTIEKEILSEEQISQGYRLACQSVPLTDLQIWLPDDSVLLSHQFMVDGINISPGEEPANISLDISVKPPTLESPEVGSHAGKSKPFGERLLRN